MAEPAQLRPPDGGWGWMVAFAYGMANIMIVPVLQSFGLIFKDTFRELQISATDASLIINLASAVGMTFGLFNGPLLRSFGFRKVATLGGVMFSLGLMATSSAERFAHFIITYSIIASLGMGFCNSSFSLALNTYFVTRRNKAAGMAMTITGLGPILLPQLVSLLVSLYGPRNCLLIIGALSTHIIAAALLLQPVKRHMVPVVPKETANGNASEAMYSAVEVSHQQITQADSKWEIESDDEEGYLDKQSYIANHEIDAQSIYGFEQTSQLRKQDFMIGAVLLPRTKSEVINPIRSRPSVAEMLVFKTYSQNFEPDSKDSKPKRWFQAGSSESVHLGSSMKLFSSNPDRRRGSLDDCGQQRRKLSGAFLGRTSPRPHKRWFEQSEDSIHLGSSLRIFDDRTRRNSHASCRDISLPVPALSQPKLAVLSENQGLTDENRLPSIMRQIERPTSPKQQPLKTTTFDFSKSKNGAPVKSLEPPPEYPRKETILTKIVAIFDLTLLRDKVYVNMMLGMSIAVFAEINFSLLTPFILNDLGYETKQIASIMSTLAVADLVFRFISPFVGDFLKLSPRIMYMIALTMLIVTRFSILLAQNYTEMMVVAFFLGVAKGVRTVYMSLVIPSYIPLKRLPAASSIQMMTNGIILMTIGPLVGLLRDLSGTYSKSIIFINAFTIVTLLMWAIEMVYVRQQIRRREREESEKDDAVDL
ncbi:monocarboxylate transporter 13-like [Uranotaenia lowii]|uniref:monocarboxylate transporter 13-like n=1 Tax=Uranotaenia lowii TaxID=190385 RepID=UPI0024783A5F|nr:monocarboxylate transporter 13-like [Uranotaenia lowii]XP_055597493.1 monocarboxylate transporter 13-like [Uranotaenia lowii]XP_055597494.1 monocarboxylate transporter 13-like [Uranotaenia lowii]XP_055597495.1 monocarboxylate transporter 13-like [Uranotaenia lowii]XP_055597496.1 monocarboxylate transporter 13-like [Uranotaenia lowii]XP_055597497.1 monocarboxylate transporter 13-like [Uranotaenia lowii]XP_055597498.1 monocarboxylate transporter 13-like [Uranotaenia lowii]